MCGGTISGSIGKPGTGESVECMSEQHGDAMPVLGEVEFTYDWYRAFLGHLDATGTRFRTYADDLETGDVVLRHDVDLSPDRALRVARIEADLGVRATYFFLLSSPLYNVHNRHTRTVIREIESMGHDVGLHFSTHQHWPDDTVIDDATVEGAVERERAALGTVADPVDAVSFHAPPDWVLGHEFEAFDSAYAPAFVTEATYRADSNQRWREEPPLADGVPDRLQVATHPGLWGDQDRPFERCVRDALERSCHRTDHYTWIRHLDPAREGST